MRRSGTTATGSAAAEPGPRVRNADLREVTTPGRDDAAAEAAVGRGIRYEPGRRHGARRTASAGVDRRQAGAPRGHRGRGERDRRQALGTRQRTRPVAYRFNSLRTEGSATTSRRHRCRTRRPRPRARMPRRSGSAPALARRLVRLFGGGGGAAKGAAIGGAAAPASCSRRVARKCISDPAPRSRRS